MATVIHNGTQYTCALAIKGDDYIHLLDDNNRMIVAFDGVSDFTCFSISGGTWSTPEDLDDCYLVVMRDDGTLVKSHLRACDVSTAPKLQDVHVYPITTDFTVTATEGYDGISTVTVHKIPASYVEPSTTQGTKTWTPTTKDQTIASGTYCSGKQTIKGDAGLIAANIRSGVTLFGVAGSLVEGGSAIGKTFNGNGTSSVQISGVPAKPIMVAVFIDAGAASTFGAVSQAILCPAISNVSGRVVYNGGTVTVAASVAESALTYSASSQTLTIDLSKVTNISFQSSAYYQVFIAY